MSLSQPDPPDPYATAATQFGFNEQATKQALGLSQTNQATPFGSLTYSTPGEVGGTATQTLTPQQQLLLNQFQRTQNQSGNVAGKLLGNTSAMYANAPDFTSTSAPLVKSQMKAFQDYMAPIYKQQESNLNSKLQNQGIGQGSEAWTNAQRGQMTSEDQAALATLMQAEPQAFQQAVTTYQTPMQTIAGLFGASTPQGVQQPFVNTPQASLEPPNFQGLTEQNYQQQNDIFGKTMQGISGLGSAAVTGLFGLGRPLR